MWVFIFILNVCVCDEIRAEREILRSDQKQIDEYDQSLKSLKKEATMDQAKHLTLEQELKNVTNKLTNGERTEGVIFKLNTL